MDEPWIAIAGALTSILAVGLGFLGARKISRDERRESRDAETRRAYGAYMGALYSVVGELRAMPADAPRSRIQQTLEGLGGEQAAWARERRLIMKHGGNRSWDLMDRLSTAIGQVHALPAPAEVRRAIDDANDYVERLARSRSPQIKDEWPKVWENLQTASAALGDAQH